MELRLLLLVILAVSFASMGAVSAASSQDDAEHASLHVDLPSEFVVTENHVVQVSIESSREVESLRLVMSVNGERRTELETDSTVPKIPYKPESIGELVFEFTADVRFEDGGEATLRARRTVPPEKVLDNRVWKGVAMPVPDKFEEEIVQAATNRSLPSENETMFWGPTTGDGTMYALLTEEEVAYGPFEMVGSLATEREQRDHVVRDEFVLCFYNANYPVFYDEPAVETPAPDQVGHGDVVSFPIDVEKVRDGFYRYRGGGTEASVVFVDHSDVLSGQSTRDVVRGAVIDVPFAHSFYTEQYGVEADLYVYPMETVESSQLPVVEGRRLIRSGETNLEVLKRWGPSDRNGYSSEGRDADPSRSPTDSDVEEPRSEDSELPGDGSDEAPEEEPQPLGVASMLVSITYLVALRYVSGEG